ncbi:Ras-GAP domain-containing protein [Entamoeba marina]
MFKREKKEKVAPSPPVVTQTAIERPEDRSIAFKVNSFWKVIRKNDFKFLELIVSCSLSENYSYWNLILDLLSSCGSFYSFLRVVVRDVISKASNERDIFKSSTGVTHLIATALRRESTTLLTELLTPVLRTINKYKEPLECDANSVSADVAKNNTSEIVELTQQFFESLENLPTVADVRFKKLLTIIHEEVEKKFNGFGSKTIAHILFVRLFAPSLVTPVKISSTLPTLNASSKRSVTNIIKLWSCIESNSTHFPNQFEEHKTKITSSYPRIEEICLSICNESSDSQIVTCPIVPPFNTVKTIPQLIRSLTSISKGNAEALCLEATKTGLQTELLECADLCGGTLLQVTLKEFSEIQYRPNSFISEANEAVQRMKKEGVDCVISDYQSVLTCLTEEVIKLQNICNELQQHNTGHLDSVTEPPPSETKVQPQSSQPISVPQKENIVASSQPQPQPRSSSSHHEKYTVLMREASLPTSTLTQSHNNFQSDVENTTTSPQTGDNINKDEKESQENQQPTEPRTSLSASVTNEQVDSTQNVIGLEPLLPLPDIPFDIPNNVKLLLKNINELESTVYEELENCEDISVARTVARLLHHHLRALSSPIGQDIQPIQITQNMSGSGDWKPIYSVINKIMKEAREKRSEFYQLHRELGYVQRLSLLQDTLETALGLLQ